MVRLANDELVSQVILTPVGGQANVVEVDDSTPVDVSVTNAVEVDDSTPVDVSVTNAVEVDDSTPVDVNVTNTVPISGTVSTTNDSNLLVASGTITFAEGDNTTVEKKTDAITLAAGFDKRPGDAFWLFAERPFEDTAGDLTINVYQVCSINGNLRDCLLFSYTIAKTAGAVTTGQPRLIRGLGRGSAGQIKVGAVFAGSDGGACTVPFEIYVD